MGKNLLLWLIIAAVLLTVFNNFNVEPKQDSMSYSDFVKNVNLGSIKEVRIQGDKIYARDGSETQYVVIWSENDQKLQDELLNLSLIHI